MPKPLRHQSNAALAFEIIKIQYVLKLNVAHTIEDAENTLCLIEQQNNKRQIQNKKSCDGRISIA